MTQRLNSKNNQWLRLYASPAGVAGSDPGQGTKILHAVQCGQKRSLIQR